MKVQVQEYEDFIRVEATYLKSFGYFLDTESVPSLLTEIYQKNGVSRVLVIEDRLSVLDMMKLSQLRSLISRQLCLCVNSDWVEKSNQFFGLGRYLGLGNNLYKVAVVGSTSRVKFKFKGVTMKGFSNEQAALEWLFPSLKTRETEP